MSMKMELKGGLKAADLKERQWVLQAIGETIVDILHLPVSAAGNVIVTDVSTSTSIFATMNERRLAANLAQESSNTVLLAVPVTTKWFDVANSAAMYGVDTTRITPDKVLVSVFEKNFASFPSTFAMHIAEKPQAAIDTITEDIRLAKTVLPGKQDDSIAPTAPPTVIISSVVPASHLDFASSPIGIVAITIGGMLVLTLLYFKGRIEESLYLATRIVPLSIPLSDDDKKSMEIAGACQESRPATFTRSNKVLPTPL